VVPVALIALTRPVPDSLSCCELTHLSRVPIDVAIARAQHAEYERALALLGCAIRHVPAAHDLPDSVFVEDTAIVLDEVAIVTRPGAESRRGEIAAVAEMLSDYRPLMFVTAPATVDGGDVLRLGRTLYVGVGARTNQAGAEQLRELGRPYGYAVRSVEVDGCLHLKSAATEVMPGCVLLNPTWVRRAWFDGQRTIEVDGQEPFAANVLRLGATVLCASACDRTRALLQSAGVNVRALDVSELAKAEGGLTCCSLVFNA
jgi:dimethylargininase